MITVKFQDGETSATVTDDVFQFDYGQVLEIDGLSLPETFNVDFSFGTNATYDSTIVAGGTNEEGISTVAVPDEMLSTDNTKDYKIFLYIFFSDDESNSGETAYTITMPVKTRPKRDSN